MSRIDKLVARLKSKPKDFTWAELIKVLTHFGYNEVKQKGKSSGSRRKFINKEKKIISLHEPHPQKIIKKYIVDQILEHLNL